MGKEEKKLKFDIQLNSVTDTSSMTSKECEFILHDFELSHNNCIIPKDTAIKSFDSLKNMPIVCRYTPTSGVGTDDDHLSGHEAYIDTDRESGDIFIATETTAIGVFTEPAYIKKIEKNGQEVEVVCGKGVLWASRCPNQVGLLKHWFDKGVTVNSSMEILYNNYSVKDGIETINSYVYEGHCILNSESRGGQDVVLPAYDVSKLNRLVAQILEEENELSKEVNSVKFKKVFELSHSDIRAKLYQGLQEVLDETAYNSAWISDVYDSFFVYDVWTEVDGQKYYQVNYTNDNDSVTIDVNSKVEVMEKREWVKVTEVQTLQTQLNEVNQKFSEATEKLTTLNSEIEVLKPIKELYEKEKSEEALQMKQEFYAAKFEAVNGKEKYDSEEVQSLVKRAVFESEDGKQAVFQLNTMLVDLVQTSTKPSDPLFKELASRRTNLMPDNTDFDSRYTS